VTATIPLKRWARLVYGDALASEVRVEGEIPVIGSGGESGLHNVANAEGPAIVIGRKGSYGTIHWQPFDCFVIDTAYYVKPIVPDVDLRWLYYALQAVDLKGVSQDVGVPGLSREDAHEVRIPATHWDEQRRIADFLDAQTARLDGLRAKRLAQISVLEELELACIGEHLAAVETTGPVYAYFDVRLGKMLNAERASCDNQQPYLRNANVHWYEIDIEDMATMTFEPDERLRYSIQPGDLLVCEGGAGVAEAAVWDGRIQTCFYQKSLHRVRVRSQVPVEWLMYWLRYSKAIRTFDAEGNIATIPHLTGEQLTEYRIPIPEDGHRRVAELKSEIAAIRETQHKMDAANTILAERRQALITAAVTGGITV
jgi:type I restriction enzyme S subunit